MHLSVPMPEHPNIRMNTGLISVSGAYVHRLVIIEKEDNNGIQG